MPLTWQADVADGAGLARVTYFGSLLPPQGGGPGAANGTGRAAPLARVARLRTMDSFYAAVPAGTAPAAAPALGFSEERRLGAHAAANLLPHEPSGVKFMDWEEHAFEEEATAPLAHGRALGATWAAPATWVRRLHSVRSHMALNLNGAAPLDEVQAGNVPPSMQVNGETTLLRAVAWEVRARFACPTALLSELPGGAAAALPAWCSATEAGDGNTVAVEGWPAPAAEAGAAARAHPHGLAPLWGALSALRGGAEDAGSGSGSEGDTPRVHTGRRSVMLRELRGVKGTPLRMWVSSPFASRAEMAAIRAGRHTLESNDAGAPELQSRAPEKPPLLAQLAQALSCFPAVYHDDKLPAPIPAETRIGACLKNLTSLLSDQPRAALAAMALLLVDPCSMLASDTALVRAVEDAAAAEPFSSLLNPPLCATLPASPAGNAAGAFQAPTSAGYAETRLSQRVVNLLVSSLGMLTSHSPYVAEEALALLLRAPHATRYPAAFEFALGSALHVVAPRAVLLDALFAVVDGLRSSAAVGDADELLHENPVLSTALIVTGGAVRAARVAFGEGVAAVPVRSYEARLLAILFAEAGRVERALEAQVARERAAGEVALALWPRLTEAERHKWRARARDLPRRVAEAAWIKGSLEPGARRAWDALAVAAHRDFLLEQAAYHPERLAAAHFGALLQLSGPSVIANATALHALRGASARALGLPWAGASADSSAGEFLPAAQFAAAAEAAAKVAAAAAAAEANAPAVGPAAERTWRAAVAHTSVVLRASANLGHADILPLLLNFTKSSHSLLRHDATAALRGMPTRAQLPLRAAQVLRGGDSGGAAEAPRRALSSRLLDSSLEAFGADSAVHADISAYLFDALLPHDDPHAAAFFPEAAPRHLTALNYGPRGARRAEARTATAEGAEETEQNAGQALLPLPHAGLFPALPALEHSRAAGSSRHLLASQHAQSHGGDVEAHLLGLALYHLDHNTQIAAVHALRGAAPLRPATLDALMDYYEEHLEHLHAPGLAAAAAGDPPVNKEQALAACATACFNAEPLCTAGLLPPARCREECDGTCNTQHSVALAIQQLLSARLAGEAADMHAAQAWYRTVEAAGAGEEGGGAARSAVLADAARRGRALSEACIDAHEAGAHLPRHLLVEPDAFAHGTVYYLGNIEASSGTARDDFEQRRRHLAALLSDPPSKGWSPRKRVLSFEAPRGAPGARLMARSRRLGVSLIDMVVNPSVAYGDSGDGADMGAGIAIDLGLKVALRVSAFDARAIFDLGARGRIWAAFMGFHVNVLEAKLGLVYGTQVVIPLGVASDYYGTVYGLCKGRENCGIKTYFNNACGALCGYTDFPDSGTLVSKAASILRNVATNLSPLLYSCLQFTQRAASTQNQLAPMMSLLANATGIQIVQDLKSNTTLVYSGDTAARAAASLKLLSASHAALQPFAALPNTTADAMAGLEVAASIVSTTASGLSNFAIAAQQQVSALASAYNSSASDGVLALAPPTALSGALSTTLNLTVALLAVLNASTAQLPSGASVPLVAAVDAEASAAIAALAPFALAPSPCGAAPPTMGALPGSTELNLQAALGKQARILVSLLEQLRVAGSRLSNALSAPALVAISPATAATLPPSLRLNLPADVWGSPASQAAALASLPAPALAANQALSTALDAFAALSCSLEVALDSALDGGWGASIGSLPSNGLSASVLAGALTNSTVALRMLLNYTGLTQAALDSAVAVSGALRGTPSALMPALSATAAGAASNALPFIQQLQAALDVTEASLPDPVALNASLSGLSVAIAGAQAAASPASVAGVLLALSRSTAAAQALLDSASGGLVGVDQALLQMSRLSDLVSGAATHLSAFLNATKVKSMADQANLVLAEFASFLYFAAGGSLLWDLGTVTDDIKGKAEALGDLTTSPPMPLKTFYNSSYAFILQVNNLFHFFPSNGNQYGSIALRDTPNLLQGLALESAAIGMLVELMAGSKTTSAEANRLSTSLLATSGNGAGTGRRRRRAAAASPSMPRLLPDNSDSLESNFAAAGAGDVDWIGEGWEDEDELEEQKVAAGPFSSRRLQAALAFATPSTTPSADPCARTALGNCKAPKPVSQKFVCAGSCGNMTTTTTFGKSSFLSPQGQFPSLGALSSHISNARATLNALSTVFSTSLSSLGQRRLLSEAGATEPPTAQQRWRNLGFSDRFPMMSDGDALAKDNKINLAQNVLNTVINQAQALKSPIPSASAPPVSAYIPAPPPSVTFGAYLYPQHPCMDYLNATTNPNGASPNGACSQSIWLFHVGTNPLGYVQYTSAKTALRAAVAQSLGGAAPADLSGFNSSLNLYAAKLAHSLAPLADALTAARAAIATARRGLKELALIASAAPAAITPTASALDAAAAAAAASLSAPYGLAGLSGLLASRTSALGAASDAAIAVWARSSGTGGGVLSAALASFAPPVGAAASALPLLSAALANATLLAPLAAPESSLQASLDAAQLSVFSSGAAATGYCDLLGAAFGSTSTASTNAGTALGASLQTRVASLNASAKAALAAAASLPAACSALTTLSSAAAALPLGFLPTATSGLVAVSTFTTSVNKLASALLPGAMGNESLAAALAGGSAGVLAARQAVNSSSIAQLQLSGLSIPAAALSRAVAGCVTVLPVFVASELNDANATTALAAFGGTADALVITASSLLSAFNSSLADLFASLSPLSPEPVAVSLALSSVNNTLNQTLLKAATSALAPALNDWTLLTASTLSSYGLPPGTPASINATANALVDLVTALGAPLLSAASGFAPARLTTVARLIPALASLPGLSDLLSASDAIVHGARMSQLDTGLGALSVLAARPTTSWGSGSSSVSAAAARLVGVQAAVASLPAQLNQVNAYIAAAVSQVGSALKVNSLSSSAPLLRTVVASAAQTVSSLRTALGAFSFNMTDAALSLRSLALPLAAAGSIAAATHPEQPASAPKLYASLDAANTALATAQTLFAASTLILGSGARGNFTSQALAASSARAAAALSPFIVQLGAAFAPFAAASIGDLGAALAVLNSSALPGAALLAALPPLAPALVDALAHSSRLSALPAGSSLLDALVPMRAAAVSAVLIASGSLPGALQAAATASSSLPVASSIGPSGAALLALISAVRSPGWRPCPPRLRRLMRRSAHFKATLVRPWH